jgi:release factor glutamine methyltransferase
MQIQILLRQAVAVLSATSDSAQADAEILLAHCLQKNRTWLKTWADKGLTAEQIAAFQCLLAQRQTGIPIAYLIGYRDFWNLHLQVTPDTLIPRPETELLVERALEKLATMTHTTGLTILDLGTGTGAIALALAQERPDIQITAVDFSLAALKIAQSNAQLNQISNVTFLQSNWFAALMPQHFDLIVSNPPYIEQQDRHLSQGDVRFEPITALASGVDGLDDIRHIIQQAPAWLKSKGWLLLEHGYHQGLAVSNLLIKRGFHHVQCLPDWAGIERLNLGQWH